MSFKSTLQILIPSAVAAIVVLLLGNQRMPALADGSQVVVAAPVGSIMAFVGDVAKLPRGWLYCNGTSVRASDYPDLYFALGNKAPIASATIFPLPDLRAMFLRGLDDGRSDALQDPDSNRVVLSVQQNDNRTHDHSATVVSSSLAVKVNPSGHPVGDCQLPGHVAGPYGPCTDQALVPAQSFYETGVANIRAQVVQNVDVLAGKDKLAVSIGKSGGPEARPNNAAVYWIIKAF